MGLRSREYGWYLLTLLALANFFNYANRNVVFPMFEAELPAGFGFSNAELGLLGTVFMVTHALLTVPLGWSADRFDRRKVIAAGAVVWSLAAVASAAADDLGQMLLARALCGAGTAACVPVANALLCDVFPAGQKARTVSIFNLGLFLGGAAGFAAGAYLGYPMGFIVVALPGLPLAFLIARLDVPPRRVGVGPAARWSDFRRDALAILAIPAMRWMLAGAVLMAFAAGGYLAWFAAFVAETKGMSIERATVVFGGSALTGGLAGVLAGGAVADVLQRRLPAGRMLTISLGFGLTVPWALLAVFVDGGPIFYLSTWLTMFFITWYHGPMAAVVDDLATDDRASTAQAGFIFTMHLLGTAPSSYVIGVLADEVGLRLAMLVPTAAVALAALAYLGACWAGTAPVGGRRRAAL